MHNVPWRCGWQTSEQVTPRGFGFFLRGSCRGTFTGKCKSYYQASTTKDLGSILIGMGAFDASAEISCTDAVGFVSSACR